MKIVHFSDLHLDAHFAWLGEDSRLARRRRQALRDTLTRIVELTQAERADALLCGGDLYEHERFTPDTADFVRAQFARLDPVPVFLSPGNHDWYGPGSLYRILAWSPNVRVFTDDHLSPYSLADGLTLWGAAHRAPANTDGFLDGFRVDRAGVHLALFHGSEQGWLAQQEGGKAPHAPFTAEQIAEAGLQHAFLGHFHRPRDAANYTYPGNPDPLTFGEDGERAAVIATITADGAVARERRRVAVSVVHDLELDVREFQHQQDLRDALSALVAPLRGLVRVTLVGTVAPRADFRLSDLAETPNHLDGLLVRAGTLQPGYDLDAISAESTVRGEFVRGVLGAGLTLDETRRVVVTGLRALDGRDDLEVS